MIIKIAIAKIFVHNYLDKYYVELSTNLSTIKIKVHTIMDFYKIEAWPGIARHFLKFLRSRRELNPRIAVLQTAALPLGYVTFIIFANNQF